MHSLLDNKNWFLHGLEYQGTLRVVVVEARTGERKEEDYQDETNETLRKILQGSVPIEVHQDSMYARVVFERVVAWQAIDESYTSWDDYEIRDDNSSLQVLSRSRYLEHINKHHGWYKDVVGLAQHYRVLTYDEIIDVVAIEPPTVEEIEHKKA